MVLTHLQHKANALKLSWVRQEVVVQAVPVVVRAGPEGFVLVLTEPLRWFHVAGLIKTLKN